MNDALLGALLVIAVGIVFWCIAVVTEERFVPALAVICDRLNIPDDVAGATLMAAGGCSPEVFSSLIALFVTHSSLGVGSVIGSEIFNHLCICAGAVFYAKGGVLVLDKAIVARESLFYGIALLLLLYLLTREHDAQNHIVIRLWAGPLLVTVYALYVVVAVNYDAILA
jgi:Ca2+/Na+ antiporter